MAIFDKVTAPLRFVENEFEALVGSLYKVYHRRTGRDQYSLSNLYLDGGFLYLWTPMISVNFPSVFSAIGAFGAGMNIWSEHDINYRAKQLDELASKNAETAKNVRREEIRFWTKYAGRIFLIVAADITLDATLGYSLHRLVGIKNLNFSVFDYFGRYSFHLIALGYYTSSIDINNPKKSKVVSAAKNLARHLKETLKVRKPATERATSRSIYFIPQP